MKEVHCITMYGQDEHIVINHECGDNEKKIICLVDDEDLTLFGLTADSYIDLSRFDEELADIANYEKILEHVLEDIAIKYKTCIHVTSANEATRCEFISSVLYGVVSCYDSKVKVYSKYELSESHGKGPVDWIIKIGDTIIVVTEAKRENINQNVGQIAIQL
ncbi:hypothetical protein C1645_735585 [Glomus cerebriforme]|uniref:Uncharacterized protein n=1 Tax=Glomus cerebriforme TaxID=658196 RepID=A0A397TES0_9GLOM|nr:hypothetical protein C1645_735585 [Glomus cerebriforme]